MEKTRANLLIRYLLANFVKRIATLTLVYLIICSTKHIFLFKTFQTIACVLGKNLGLCYSQQNQYDHI